MFGMLCKNKPKRAVIALFYLMQSKVRVLTIGGLWNVLICINAVNVCFGYIYDFVWNVLCLNYIRYINKNKRGD